MIIIQNEDIALSHADAIVNASNGQGYMGGQRCINALHKGVAESLQFQSKGEIEKLSRSEARKHFLGFAPGEVFVTPAPGLNTKHIIHAVTMRFPGSRSKICIIKKLLPKIDATAEVLNAKTVAIPLLGTGTGQLHKDEVMNLFIKELSKSSINYLLYVNNEGVD